MPPPSQPTALPAEVRAPLCHIAKKEWLSQVPTALHWGVKRLTTLLRVPLPPPPSTRRLTYSTPLLKGEKRGAAWHGLAEHAAAQRKWEMWEFSSSSREAYLHFSIPTAYIAKHALCSLSSWGLERASKHQRPAIQSTHDIQGIPNCLSFH